MVLGCSCCWKIAHSQIYGDARLEIHGVGGNGALRSPQNLSILFPNWSAAMDRPDATATRHEVNVDVVQDTLYNSI